jgi:hypothetical protein
MRIQPLTLETLLEWLQKQAAEHQTALIVHARIAISAREARLLAIQPEGFLETIHY